MTRLTLFFLLISSLHSRSQQDSILFEKAIDSIRNGEIEQGLYSLGEAIELNENEILYFETKAFILSELKRNEEAISVITLGISKNPKDAIFWNTRGLIYFRNKQHELAISDFDRALKLVKKDVNLEKEILSARASAKTYSNDPKGAEKDFKKALKIDSLHFDSHIDLGILYGYNKSFDNALKHFNKANEIKPNDFFVLTNIGFLFTESGDYEKAIPILTEAISLEPETSSPRNNRGFAYLQLGQLQKAEIDIVRAIELDPQNSYAHKNKALLHIAREEYEDACLSLDSALTHKFREMYGSEVDELKKEYCK